MKKRIPLKLLISLMAVCIAISIVACDQAEEETVLESLTLVTTHNGAYVLGENINLSEITFSANYSDDTSKTVTLNDTQGRSRGPTEGSRGTSGTRSRGCWSAGRRAGRSRGSWAGRPRR